MRHWRLEPESTLAHEWELRILEEYADYKIANCSCWYNEDCDCLSLEDFREKKIKDQQDRWDKDERIYAQII